MCIHLVRYEKTKKQKKQKKQQKKKKNNFILKSHLSLVLFSVIPGFTNFNHSTMYYVEGSWSLITSSSIHVKS